MNNISGFKYDIIPQIFNNFSPVFEVFLDAKISDSYHTIRFNAGNNGKYFNTDMGRSNYGTFTTSEEFREYKKLQMGRKEALKILINTEPQDKKKAFKAYAKRFYVII